MDLLNKKLEHLSRLQNAEFALILQNNLFAALEIEDPSYIEWEILTKLVNIEYTERDNLCRFFRDALLRNEQLIAGKPVKIWILEYLRNFPPPPKLDNFIKFSEKLSLEDEMNAKEKLIILKILRIHDYLLFSPILSLDDIRAEIVMRYPMYLSQPFDEIKKEFNLYQFNSVKKNKQKISEKLPLRDLLRKYPAVGEQNITGGQLKLSHFNRPVRPSIKNWIYDYTSQLGQERHDSMQRMKYLFSSLNGKNLASPDREKLGIILKSFDENIPLPVDAGRNEIIFGRSEEENPNFPVSNASHSDAGRQIPTSNRIPKLKPQVSKFAPIEGYSAREPQQQSFVKPYTKTYETPRPSPPAKPQINYPQVKTEPQKPNIQEKTGNSAQSAGDMQFANPYPRPGTHEPQFAKPVENISNLRFNEGLPKKSAPARQNLPVSPQEVPSKPGRRNEPPKPYAPSRPKNIFYPHYGPGKEEKPEPRIDGNIVDLKGDK